MARLPSLSPEQAAALSGPDRALATALAVRKVAGRLLLAVAAVGLPVWMCWLFPSGPTVTFTPDPALEPGLPGLTVACGSLFFAVTDDNYDYDDLASGLAYEPGSDVVRSAQGRRAKALPSHLLYGG